MPHVSTPSFIVPIPVTMMNVVKYLFEVTIISAVTNQIGRYLGRHSMLRGIEARGFVTFRENRLRSKFLPGAPPTYFAMFVGLLVHAIMIEFELSFGVVSAARAISVPVIYPAHLRESGLSGPMWTEAANSCCKESNEMGNLVCSKPVKFVGYYHPENYSRNSHLLLGGSWWGCQGSDPGQVGISRGKSAEIRVYAKQRSGIGCSSTYKNGVNMTICGLSVSMREEIIKEFKKEPLSVHRDPFVEFRRYYLASGLWNENELVEENGMAFNEEFSQTSIRCSALGVLIIFVFWFLLFLTARYKHKRQLNLILGSNTIISVLHCEQTGIDALPQGLEKEINLIAVRTGEKTARLLLRVDGQGEPGLLHLLPSL